MATFCAIFSQTHLVTLSSSRSKKMKENLRRKEVL
jgi:hypothetical protein